MTNAVQPVSAPSVTPVRADAAADEPPRAGTPASSVIVDVSRGRTAPIYVYRMTDTATGRTLIEIPTQQAVIDPDQPGARLDAKA